MIIKDLFEMWLEDKQLQIRDSSLNNYIVTINKWINPKFGELDIKDITKKDLQDFIIEFAKAHKNNTVINLTKPLSQLFKWTIDNGYNDTNPWIGVLIPKFPEEKQIKMFKECEIEKLLSARGFRQIKKDIILIAALTGMRIGEILTLKFRDVNFDDKYLIVNRTLSGYKKITKPKTKSSIRRIDLDNKSIDLLLKRYREINNNNEFFVFGTKDNTIYSEQWLDLQRMCRSVGIEPRGPHAIRHYHATMLLRNGADAQVLQWRLGHTDITTTYGIYGHYIPGAQKHIVDIINQLPLAA